MKYQYIGSVLIALFVVHALRAQIKNVLKPVDVFNIEYVSDPQISPDGLKVLYVRNFKDIMTDKDLSNLWMVNFDGSNNLPLTTGNQIDNNAVWSPDGTRVAYISNRNQTTQIYLRWLKEGVETKLTNLTETPKSLSWSPDGRWIVFNMFVPVKEAPLAKLEGKPDEAIWNQPPIYIDDMQYRSDGKGYLEAGNEQLFVISVEGGTPRQITNANNDVGKGAWSPDSRSLFFHANLEEDADYNPRNTEIYQINLELNITNKLTSRQGPDANPIVSPDGKQIAFTGYDDRFQGYQVTHLYLMDINGENPRAISTQLDRDITNVHWTDDGRGFYLQYQDRGNNKIAHMSLSGQVTDLADDVGGLSLGRPYTRGDFSQSRGRFAYTLSTPNHPSDLAVGDGRSLVRRITALNDDLFSYTKVGRVEEIWYKSSFDQRDIQGWICYPPDFDPTKKYPMILEIHGGPFMAYGPWFSMEIQLYAAAGYVVLYTNPRGSTSYGEEFGNLIHHNYPGEDYEDLMSGVDAVIEREFINTDELYVTGGSGGGVLTAWIVGKTDRFKAAVVAKPVINWYSFVLYSDATYYHKYWFPGVPWEHQDQYMKRSPISLVGNVSTPTMLLTGEADYRTPIGESEQYYRALKLQKVETAMVRIPGASHGIASRPSNLMAKVANILAWFDRYRNTNDQK